MLTAETLKPPLRRLAVEAAVALLFGALTMAMLWPLPLALSTHTVDVGVDDPLLFARLLGHHFDWLQGRRAFFDAAFFHPTPWALTTTDASLGVLYVAAPFLPFTRDLLALVNLGILLSFALTAHATYLLVRDLTRSRGAGIVAGAAFAFCLYRFHQLDHSNVLQMQWLVYALWALLRLRREPRWGNGLLLALFVFLHGSASVNLAAYGAVLLAAAAAWALITVPPASRRRFVLVSLAAAALALPALAALYRPYVLSSAIFETKRAVEEVRLYSGTLEQLLAAPPYNRLYGPTRSALMGRESLTFLGWAVIALAAAGLLFGAIPLERGASWRSIATAFAILAAVVGAAALGLWRRELAMVLVVALFGLSAAAPRLGLAERGAMVWLFAAVALFYLYASFGPDVRSDTRSLGPGLWAWLMDWPPFSAIRTPSRLFFVTSLGAAIAAGAGVAAVAERLPRTVPRALLAALATLAVLFEARAAPLPMRRMHTLDRAPSYYHWLAVQPGQGAVVELPLWEGIERYRMYFAMIHRRPIVDGVSGFVPPSLRWVSHSSFQSGAAVAHLERLRASGLEFAVLHTYLLGASSLEKYRSALQVAGASQVSSSGGVEIWRFPPAPSLRSFDSDTTLAVIRAAPAAEEGQPLEVTVGFAARGPAPVHELRVRKLTLIGDGEGISFRSDVFFAPPLLAAAIPEIRESEIPLSRTARAVPLRLRLLDEEGRQWAALDTRVHAISQDERPALEARYEVGECRISIVDSAANSRTHRWIARIEASDRATWAGPTLRHLRAIDPSTGASLFSRRLPAMAGGSSVLYTVEIDSRQGGEIELRITDAAGAKADCSTRAPVAAHGG